jgi:hypothetical protein
MATEEFSMAVITNSQSSGYLRPWVWLIEHSCENIVLWRGHFNATESTQSVNLSINGGEGGLVVIM